MSRDALAPCTAPTLYFIGVTTARSSIMTLFPAWSELLGLGARIVGYDAPLHAEPEVYRAVVAHIRRDPLAAGALVTSHKLDLLEASRDLFDELDPLAELCDEVSCISKRDGRLIGHAKDPLTSGMAWESFVPSAHWEAGAKELLCLGAGGAATAITAYLAGRSARADRPDRVVVVDRSPHRLEELRALHGRLGGDIEFSYLAHEDPRRNDALLTDLPAGSMVINATGMGKDRPGSPITARGLFPLGGLVWELNYRGELDFLHQARRQANARRLTVEDGWVYFLHGWSQVIAEVFGVELDAATFAALDAAAASLKPER